MIRSMTKYSFILLSGDQESFLTELQELGLMDITRSAKPVDGTSEQLLDKALAFRRIIPDAREEVNSAAKRIADAEKEAAALRPWGEFDPSSISAVEGCSFHWYTIPKKDFREEWKDLAAIEIVSEEGGKCYFVAILPDGEENPIPVPEVRAPQYSYRKVEERIEVLKKEKEALEDKLSSLEGRSDEFESRYREAMADLDRYMAGVSAVPAAENTISTLVGYAPSDLDEKVTAFLDSSDVFYLKDAAQVRDNPPISLKNNKFVSMFETLTDMYGRPSYDGFDPTVFLSIFFLLFFALCMGDAGYGLVLIAVGFLLKKVESFRKTAPLVITLGVATLFVGFFMHTFFSIDISQWKVFEPIKGIFLPAEIAGYDGAMVLSLLIGVIHLCLAMVVKTYISTRNNGFLESLGTWGWTLLIVGGVIVAGIALAGVIDAAATKWIIIVLGIVSALGIFVFNNIHRNPLLNIGSGLWDTYNTATGLLGDVLSYLRLYALGLAGAMLGFAFNDLGKMVLGDGSSIGGWIGFILIVIVGHTLNIAMCALGAFVHPLRLNFLEFFKNSGYEGSGRNYKPLEK